MKLLQIKPHNSVFECYVPFEFCLTDTNFENMATRCQLKNFSNYYIRTSVLEIITEIQNEDSTN